MKIKKFNENIEDELISKYNEDKVSYEIKGVLQNRNDIYLGVSSYSLNEFLEKYDKLISDTNISYVFHLYVLENKVQRRVIPQKELDILLNAKKYNL